MYVYSEYIFMCAYIYVCVYIYIQLNHYDLQQELAHVVKSIIHQLKKMP